MDAFSLFFSVGAAVFFGSLAIIFSYREEKARKTAETHTKDELSRQVHDLSLLNNISEKIGYSLNIESVAQTIVENIRKIKDSSFVSYTLIGDGKIRIKSFVKNGLPHEFLEKVRADILDSIYSIYPLLKNDEVLEEKIAIESDIASPFDIEIRSYLNIPLVVNEKLVGVVSVASDKKDLYTDDEKIIMQMIVNTAMRTLGKITELIETEKVKTDSLIASLSSGAMLFLRHENNWVISTINTSAKNFLNIKKDEVEAADVFSAFKNLDIATKINQTLETKTPIEVDGVDLNNKHLKLFINPVFSSGKENILGVSITMQDITIEKDIEAMRNTFTNTVIHELRAPLSAIQGAAKLLMSGNLSKEDMDKMLHVIDDSVKQGMLDVSDLLDAAKIDSGKLKIEMKYSDINALIKERAEEFSFSAKEKGITITYHSQAGLDAFYFDPTRIGQVLNNLISNSIKYTEENGQITIQTRTVDGNLEVLVSDTGIGISRDKIGLLFSKFGEVGAHVSNSSGLGLYIAKGIVESHGGKIWVESEENQGTKVYFTLPLSQARAETTIAQQTLQAEKLVN